jgi:hypothetical protein
VELKMNPNSNVIAQLIIDELPGLVGALQPPRGGQNLNELARRQRSRNLSNALLAGASGLLSPSPNRYPLGLLQRLGAGLGAAVQSYNQGANQEGILEALGMNGGGASAGGAAPHPRFSQAASKAIRTPPVTSAEEALTAESSISGRRSMPREPRGMQGAGKGATLRKFSGVLTRRLEHPAVLPGGWQLYGYEKESGNPVYIGPKQELRTYA